MISPDSLASTPRQRGVGSMIRGPNSSPVLTMHGTRYFVPSVSSRRTQGRDLPALARVWAGAGWIARIISRVSRLKPSRLSKRAKELPYTGTRSKLFSTTASPWGSREPLFLRLFLGMETGRDSLEVQLGEGGDMLAGIVVGRAGDSAD